MHPDSLSMEVDHVSSPIVRTFLLMPKRAAIIRWALWLYYYEANCLAACRIAEN